MIHTPIPTPIIAAWRPGRAPLWSRLARVAWYYFAGALAVSLVPFFIITLTAALTRTP